MNVLADTFAGPGLEAATLWSNDYEVQPGPAILSSLQRTTTAVNTFELRASIRCGKSVLIEMLTSLDPLWDKCAYVISVCAVLRKKIFFLKIIIRRRRCLIEFLV